VARGRVKDVPVEIRAIGTVEPAQTVLGARPGGGELLGVHFREGEDVKKGQVLFTLDPRPSAALRKAEADLPRDRALAVSAEAEAKRTRASSRRTTPPASSTTTRWRRPMAAAR
jgi:multidrug efflux system membrane fusion protein